MNETPLRQLLDRALDGEPPLGPIAQNSLRAGIKLRRRRRAVGAAGIVIVATCAAIIPATIGIPGRAPVPAAGHRPAGLAGAPKFFAGVTEQPPGQYRATVVNIYRSATGQVAASIRPPKPFDAFVAVSRLGGDRTFVAAAISAFSRTACTSHLFQFSIDGQGHPSALTPLSVPQVTGHLAELVGSADGNALAYTVSGCATGQQAAGMINLATRQTTTWIVPHHGHLPVSFGSLSLTGDGSRLGFVVGSPAGPVGPANAYVLPTDSPSGPLMRHATRVLHVPTGVFRVVLSNNGSQAYVETRSASPEGAVVLSQYSTTTGERVRLLGRLGPGGHYLTQSSVAVDATGRDLLAYSDTHRLTVVNLTTGRQASITAAQIPYLEAAYTTTAW
jgi:hypothetical protein